MTIYFVQEGETGPIKIGHAKTMRNVLSTLQTGNPEELSVRLVLPGGRTEAAELHKRFATHCIRLEWFRATQDIRAFIKEQRRMGLPKLRHQPPWKRARHRIDDLIHWASHRIGSKDPVRILETLNKVRPEVPSDLQEVLTAFRHLRYAQRLSRVRTCVTRLSVQPCERESRQ